MYHVFIRDPTVKRFAGTKVAHAQEHKWTHMNMHTHTHTCVLTPVLVRDLRTRLFCETNYGRDKEATTCGLQTPFKTILLLLPEFFVSCSVSINWVLWVLSAVEHLRWLVFNKHSGGLLFRSPLAWVRLLGPSPEPHAADKGKSQCFPQFAADTQGSSFHSASGFFWGFLTPNLGQRCSFLFRLHFQQEII